MKSFYYFLNTFKKRKNIRLKNLNCDVSDNIREFHAVLARREFHTMSKLTCENTHKWLHCNLTSWYSRNFTSWFSWHEGTFHSRWAQAHLKFILRSHLCATSAHEIHAWAQFEQKFVIWGKWGIFVIWGISESEISKAIFGKHSNLPTWMVEELKIFKDTQELGCMYKVGLSSFGVFQTHIT